MLARPKEPKNKVTAAVRRHWSKVASLGCIICEAPAAELHHPTGAGMALKASHMEVIPLCHAHHNGGKYSVSVHAGTKRFEYAYGTQNYLLNKTKKRMKEEYGIIY